MGGWHWITFKIFYLILDKASNFNSLVSWLGHGTFLWGANECIFPRRDCLLGCVSRYM